LSEDNTALSFYKFFRDGDNPPLTPASVASVGRVIMSYQLLDILAWASDWPAYFNRPPASRSHPPNLTANLQRVVEKLDNWTSIVLSLGNPIMNFLESPSSDTAGGSSIGMPSIPSSSVITTEHGTDLEPHNRKSVVQNFIQTTLHSTQRKIHDVMEQWTGVATVIGAFKPVSFICLFQC
jgi:hypothetical protein